MGFASVYRCLQELFPQLDARLLKAVAIENSKDADAAVEVVLSEILPRITANEKPPSPKGKLASQNHLDEEVQEEDGGSLLRRHRAFEKVNTSQSNFPMNADGEASISIVNDPADAAALVNEALFCDGSGLIDKSHGAFGSEEMQAPKTAEESRAASLNQNSHAQLVAMHHFNVAKIPDESNGTTESEELILLGMMNELPTSTRQTSYDAPSIQPDVSDFETDECGKYEKDSTASQAHSTDHGNERCQYKNEDIFLENLVCQLEPVLTQKHAPKADLSEDVYAAHLNDGDATAEAGDDTSAVQGSAAEESLNMTRSSQIVEVDLLKQIIEDAKNNKKTLFSAMESVINTMKEVEERERAADQAREEAARRSSDVWRRIEELKRMIQSAKEANDMHAGEVYGERAILATEVRELQSRLLSLCDERDRSLAILDEMRNALETRLAAAEEVIETAEHEKQAKVEYACNALKEQEALMEKVVHESKVLQEEAEENTKLREFLMDRGRIVDQLQGEIAVICQDVKLLKERFDSGVALSKSISSGQTSCILASSSSSLSNSTSSDQVPNHGETYKTPDGANLGASVDKSSPRREPKYENATGADEKEHADEGWELCDA